MLSVEGVTVRVAERNYFLLPAIEIEPVNLVDGFVAYVEEARVIPHRTFGKPEAGAHNAQPGVVIHQIPELRRIRLQSKFSRQGWDSAKACCAYCNKQQGCNAEDTQDFHAAI